jgi:hypothetical protein
MHISHTIHLVAVNGHMDIHPCGMVYLAIWAFIWYSKNMGSNPIATISYFIVLLGAQVSWGYQLGLRTLRLMPRLL